MKPEEKRYILDNIEKKPVSAIARELGLKERKVKKFLDQEKEKAKRNETQRRPSAMNGIVLLSVALIVVLGFAIYANSLNGEFIRDDQYLVRDNIYIKSWSHLEDIFTKNIAAGGKKQWNSYRPIQMVTYLIDHSFWRLDVRGYHATNILLHVLAALSVFWFISILYGDRLLAFITTVLFAVHPIHTGAVSFISGRADALAALLLLLSFIIYVSNLERQHIGIAALNFMVYSMALFSRENAIILPALLLVYHYIFKKKIKMILFLPILVAAVTYLLLRVTLLSYLLSNIAYDTTLFQRIPGFFVALIQYIRLLLVPVGLHLEYGNRLFGLHDPRAIGGIVICYLALFYLFKKRDARSLFSFGMLWFFIALLPHSNIYPINAYMAEHWLYLPSVGFFLVLAHIFCLAYRKRALRIVSLIFIIGLTGAYAYGTVRQNEYWREPVAFYERTLKFTPDSYRSYANLGNELNALGKRKEAIAAYKKAIEINPGYATAYSNLGAMCAAEGLTAEAIEAYLKAINADPQYADPHSNLGSLYVAMGKNEEGIRLYLRALEIDPSHTGALNNLGIIYYTLGKAEEAFRLFKRAIEINPYQGTSHNNIARVYFDRGEYNLAIKHCDMAMELGYNVRPEVLKLLEPYRR